MVGLAALKVSPARTDDPPAPAPGHPGTAAAVRRRRWRGGALSLGMLAPAVLVYTVMTIVPVVVALYLSLTDWNGFSDATFIGTENYLRLFEDPGISRAWLVTFVVAAFGSVGMLGLGLAYALQLKERSRTNSFFRALAYYPHVISALILGFLWSAILGTNGAINTTLERFGVGPVGFLFDETLAVITLVGVIVWAGFGFNVVLFVAALQTVPHELIEAAQIDGASRRQINRRIVIPMISPVVTVAMVLNLVGLIKVYDIVVSLTDGGPAGSTETIAYVILSRSFASTDVGFATAQAVALMVVSAVLSVLVAALRNRQDQAAAN
ncbi:carbohydrate ABC transporter permease [Jiangella muralis]|uniref:carbohydrate ABC transporter permease n=1 Tax=Jiangella muralis TaxID=702383 RepID=UPI001969E791|nr:sugar ABC transporter permease [Jiangella muralis]